MTMHLNLLRRLARILPLATIVATLAACFDFEGLKRNNSDPCPENMSMESQMASCMPPPPLACTPENFMKVCYGDSKTLMCEEGRCVSGPTGKCETSANCAKGLVCTMYQSGVRWGNCAAETSTNPAICQPEGNCALGIDCKVDSNCATKVCTAGKCAPAPDPNACKATKDCPVGNICDTGDQCTSKLCDTSRKTCVLGLNVTCGSNTDCQTGAFCTSNGDNPSKTCKNPNGGTCNANPECISGSCVAGKCLGKYMDPCSSPDACASGLCVAGKCDLPNCATGNQLDDGPICGEASATCKRPLCGARRVVSKKADCDPVAAPDYGGLNATSRGVCAKGRTIAVKLAAACSATKIVIGQMNNRTVTDLSIGKWAAYDTTTDTQIRSVAYLTATDGNASDCVGEALVFTTAYTADKYDATSFWDYGAWGASAETPHP